MTNKERPLSPHLTIYKPQISSVLSIMHRITGVALYFAMLIAAWVFVIDYFGDDYIKEMTEFLSGNIWILFVILTSLAMSYHFYNGIRHLFWDSGKFLELKAVKITGIIVVIATIVTALSFWGIVFFSGAM